MDRPPAPGTGTNTSTEAAPLTPATGLLPLAAVERRHNLRVLELVKGNRTVAANALEIGRNTLARKLKEYGLSDEG
jgi:Nif-specific regulatory protein